MPILPASPDLSAAHSTADEAASETSHQPRVRRSELPAFAPTSNVIPAQRRSAQPRPESRAA